MANKEKEKKVIEFVFYEHIKNIISVGNMNLCSPELKFLKYKNNGNELIIDRIWDLSQYKYVDLNDVKKFNEGLSKPDELKGEKLIIDLTYCKEHNPILYAEIINKIDKRLIVRHEYFEEPSLFKKISSMLAPKQEVSKRPIGDKVYMYSLDDSKNTEYSVRISHYVIVTQNIDGTYDWNIIHMTSKSLKELNLQLSMKYGGYSGVYGMIENVDVLYELENPVPFLEFTKAGPAKWNLEEKMSKVKKK